MQFLTLQPLWPPYLCFSCCTYGGWKCLSAVLARSGRWDFADFWVCLGPAVGPDGCRPVEIYLGLLWRGGKGAEGVAGVTEP